MLLLCSYIKGVMHLSKPVWDS